jgi:hypothetical protein
MKHALACFLAAAGVTLIVNIVVGLSFGIFWRNWGRSFAVLDFFASTLQAGFVLFGTIGYVIATSTRSVFPTLKRAFISGASFPFGLAAILLGIHFLALKYSSIFADFSVYLTLLVAFVVGAISSLIIRHDVA